MMIFAVATFMVTAPVLMPVVVVAFVNLAVVVVVWIALDVAGDLKDEESQARKDQCGIGSGGKCLEALGGSPSCKEPDHHRECRHLTQFHTHIKGENPPDQPLIAKGQLLEPGGQTKAVDQAKAKDHGEQVGGFD